MAHLYGTTGPTGSNGQSPINNIPLQWANYGAEEAIKNMEAKAIRELTIDNANSILVNVLRTNVVPFLWGPPGVGKSSLIREICKQQEWKLIDLRLSLLNPVDLRGLPVLDKKNKTAEWYAPSFLPAYDDPNPGLLFLDEINLAPMSTQSAAYQLILDKRIGEYRFPPNWRIVAAGNREIDKANVYKISAPLANRFIHFTISPDFKSWSKWANNNVRPEIIEFLLTRPALLYQLPQNTEKAFPSPRTWEFTSKFLDAYGYAGDTSVPPELERIILSTVGEGPGRELVAYLNDDKLKSVSVKIKDFINTGKLTLPKDAPNENSVRYAFIVAIHQARMDGRLKAEYYNKVFVPQLSKEEVATIDRIQKDFKDKLKEKFGSENL